MHNGIIPAAAPATVEILKNVPVKLNHVEGECTTPTGAAIIKSLSDKFIKEINLNVSTIGYGVGHKKFEKPNLLRTFICEEDGDDEEIVYEISANIDDMSCEIYSYLFDKILNEGALDVYAQSIYMKKNRPAYKISILVEEKDLQKFTKIILEETSTFGLRYNKYNRCKLDRKLIDIDTKYGTIKFKLGYYNGKLIKAKPEYEQCKDIAFNLNVPIKEIYDSINISINEEIIENLLT